MLPRTPPVAAGNGGMRQQLNSLRAGIHPVTGLRLPESSGSTALGNGTYSRLKPCGEADADFTPYVPALFDPAAPSGASAERKRWLMRGRVLCKMGREDARLRRQRRKEAKAEVSEVIRTFIQATNGGEHARYEEMAETRSHADGDELRRSADDLLDRKDEADSEEFWMNLPASDSRTGHIQGIPTQAIRNYPGMIVKWRADALRAAILHDKNVVDSSR